MTPASGENPPRPEDDDLTASLPKPPQRIRREPNSQANLWSNEESGADAAPEARVASDGDSIWSRDRAETPEPSATLSSDEPVEEDDDDLFDATLEDEDDVGPYRELVSANSSGVRVRRVAWELIQTLVLAALIFLMVRGVAQNFRVEGPSMEPGLHDGQYLLVNKAVYFKLDLDKLSRYLPFIDGGDNPSRFLFHGPERGDVVVFRYPRDPSRDFIKRIIGVPGDTVSIAEGVVSVNGETLDEPYINLGSITTMEAKVVPEGSYFVMGDNRPNSSDSRNWGFVPEENIIGKAMFSYWPMNEFGGVGNRSIDLGFVKVPLF